MTWQPWLVVLLVGCSGPDGAATSSGDGGQMADGMPTVGPGCGLRTTYAGDDRCLVAPTSGIQLHYGPSSYDDPAEIAKYTLAPGAEDVRCATVLAKHVALNLAGFDVSERQGMHHLALFDGPAPAADPLHPCSGAIPLLLAQEQRVKSDVSGGAPEYAGAAVALPVGSFSVQAHALNSGDLPMLLEAWLNLDLLDTVRVPMNILALTGGHSMAVPPHTQQTVKDAAACIGTPRTVIQLVGHMHAHGVEERAYFNGQQIYQTRDWREPVVQWFTSKTTGAFTVAVAPVAPATWTGPSVGGYEILPGSSLAWECDINNTTGATLRWANLVESAEMCNLYGYVVGTSRWLR